MLILSSRIPVFDRVSFSHDSMSVFACGSMVPDLRFKPFNHGLDCWRLGQDVKVARRYFDGAILADFVVNPLGRWVYVALVSDLATSTSCCYSLDTSADDVHALAESENGLTLCTSGEWVAGLNASWQPYRLHLVRWDQPRDSHPKLAWSVSANAGRRKWLDSLTAHPNGRVVVGQQYDTGVVVQDSVHELAVFDMTTGKRIAVLPAVSKQIARLAFSPDGDQLIAQAGRTLLVWRTADWSAKPRKVTGDARSHFTGLAFHPSGRLLAVTSNDTTVRSYDTSTWTVAHTYTWNIGRMRSVAFSPDGTLAAAGSDTGKIVVWDVDVS